MIAQTQLEPQLLGSRSRLTSSCSRPQSPSTRQFSPTISIVLIGSRGAGKRTLGFIGATHLGRRLITEDHYFQEATGLSRGDFLRQHGNSKFYRRNVEVLKQMLDQHRSGCIIECGMGSLSCEAQNALREYSKTNPVIYITRARHRIRSMLKLEECEALRLETADLSHRTCSNLEYYNLYDPCCDGMDTPPGHEVGNVSSRLKYAKEDFCKFLDYLTGQGLTRNSLESPFSIAALPPECRLHTYALSLRLSTIPELDLVELEAGADAVQLKIDTWSSDLQTTMAKQVAIIRRKLDVPIIFHVEDYAFVDLSLSTEQKQSAYFELLECGLRLGVEYIVVDLRYSDDLIANLVRCSGPTKVIGHYLAKQESQWEWNGESCTTQYRRAKSLRCDMARLVRATSEESDNDAVKTFLAKVESIPDHLPIIAYNLGENGRSSLIANRTFTPVTHPLMQTTISKTQIRQFLPTAAEALQGLYQYGILDPLSFKHLGAVVFYSLSPAMHTAAYRVCGMSNDFQSLEVSSLEDVRRRCRDPNFGGAAITQPFKVEILHRIAATSYHAEAIGAVNTLLPLRKLPNNKSSDGSIQSLLQHANQRGKSGPIIGYYGDNTDFIGILTCLRRSISPRNIVQPSRTTGLVIGAGGMARAAVYALIQLGCRKIFMYNRTVAHAEDVARHFNSWTNGLNTDGQVVHVLKSTTESWPAGFKQPTIIISCVTARSIGDQPPANFEMPVHWLQSSTGGVVVELSYLPLDTPLLKQIRQFREETNQAWVIVNGLEVLPEQAIAQFELMTGRKAPKRRMRLEVLQHYSRYE